MGMGGFFIFKGFKERKKWLLIVPLALLLVVAAVVMSSRADLENEQRDELHGVMEDHLEEMLEENGVASWDQEMNGEGRTLRLQG